MAAVPAQYLLGNLALLVDAISTRDWKNRLTSDVVLPRKDAIANQLANAASRSFEVDSESRSHGVGRPPRTKRWRDSKANDVDFDGADSDGENGFDGGDWEKEMRRRVKEMEEMKELEKKAEELQSREASNAATGDGGDGESEEEKRKRVRKELEKASGVINLSG